MSVRICVPASGRGDATEARTSRSPIGEHSTRIVEGDLAEVAVAAGGAAVAGVEVDLEEGQCQARGAAHSSQKFPGGHPWKPAIFLGPVNRDLMVQKQMVLVPRLKPA